MTHRVLLIDDRALFRQGLRALLAAQSEFTIVAEAGDAGEAIAALVTHRPDIVLTDVLLPGPQGLSVIESLKRRMPALRVVVLTEQRGDDLLRSLLRAGVEGYLLKDSSFEELMLGLRTVSAGHKYLSPRISGHIVDTFLDRERRGRGDSPLAQLTSRERSILQLIAEGRSNRAAAEALNLSTKTVEKHRASLMRKLGLRNAAELMMVAVETGLVARPTQVARLVAPGAS